MKISVVIPVYNAEETIKICLEGLLAQDKLPEEIILIDNGSKDESVNIIKDIIRECLSPKFILDFEHKRGPAPARNKGINISKGDIIAFLDADCVPKYDWIKNILIKFQKDPALVGIGGRTEGFEPANSIEKLIASFRYYEFERKDNVNKIDIILGAYIPTRNAAYKKEALESVGLFDESLFAEVGEDVDIYLRLLDRNYKMVVWDQDIVVRHKERNNLGKFIRRIVQYRMAEVKLVRIHFPKQAIISLPFNKVFHKKDTIFTIWIESPAILIGLSLFIIIGIFLNKFVYFILLILGLSLIDNIRRLKITAIRFNLKDLLLMTLLLMLQKIVSELTKIYSSFKYKVIYL